MLALVHSLLNAFMQYFPFQLQIYYNKKTQKLDTSCLKKGKETKRWISVFEALSPHAFSHGIPSIFGLRWNSDHIQHLQYWTDQSRLLVDSHGVPTFGKDAMIDRVIDKHGSSNNLGRNCSWPFVPKDSPNEIISFNDASVEADSVIVGHRRNLKF